MKSFYNLYKNERIFIIGNGPSLNLMDLTFLKDEITFGVNCIFYLYKKMGFKPTFYVVEDKLVAEDRAEEINGLTGSIKIFGKELSYCLKDSGDVVWANVIYDYSNYPSFPNFSKNASECLWVGGTVSYLCLQLAYYMGAKDVFLIGFDHNYHKPDEAEITGNVITSLAADKNHFHPECFGVGKRWHNPEIDRMELAYQRAQKVFQEDGRSIFNATIGGNLELFERVDYDKLFKRRPKKASGSLARRMSKITTCVPSSNEMHLAGIKNPQFSHLILDYTRKCNGRCTYCSIWKEKNGPELGLDVIEDTFFSLQMYGLGCCYVTGGEPYISDKIIDIAKLLHKYLPGCVLTGATNAVQPDRVLERMFQIVKLGVPLQVHVSINGRKETHDATRGEVGLWDKAVYLLDTVRSWGVPTVAAMSLMPQTIADIPFMQKFCLERNIPLTFSWVRQAARYSDVDESFSSWPENVKGELRKIEYLPELFDCPGLVKRLVIVPEGDVYPCEVYNKRVLLGNVNQDRLDKILHKREVVAIKDLIVARGCDWCQGGGDFERSPKWMFMDCYRRASVQAAHFKQRVPQAIYMSPEKSKAIIDKIVYKMNRGQVISQDKSSLVGSVGRVGRGSVRISVIVCTHCNPVLLKKTLASLDQQTLDDSLFEIIVVDNNSKDLTKQVIDGFPSMHYLYEGKLGLSFARNAGIKASKGDIIAFIDDDAEASPEWLEALLEIYEKVPKAWAVGGKVLPVWDAEKPEWLTTKFYRSLSLVEWGEEVRELHWPERIIGTNCSFRKKVFEHVGLFDTNLGRIGSLMLGNEDTEIQQRIISFGRLVYYTPVAVVYHHVPASRMTPEYFKDRLQGTRVSEEIMELRAQGKELDIQRIIANLRKKLDPQLNSSKDDIKLMELLSLNREGLSLLSQENYEGALLVFQKAIELDPGFCAVHYNMGLLHYKCGDNGKALVHFRLAAQLQPDNIEYKKALADFYFVVMKQVGKAIDIYKEVLDQAPEDDDVLLMLAKIYLSLQRWGESEFFCRRLLAADPQNQECITLLKKLSGR